MIFHWPQIVAALLMVLALGIKMERHGKPRTGNDSFWLSLTATCIWIVLLYYGGFWR